MTKTEMLEMLREVRKAATFQHACFRIGQEPGPFGAECTDLVKVATRLYRESWLIGPLDEVIAALDGTVKP